MFTGLVQSIGEVSAFTANLDGYELAIKSDLTAQLKRGDSIAISGVCLTVTTVDSNRFGAQVVAQTLDKTNLATFEVGDRVNLELPLRPSDRLGGHFVQGHVDGVGTVKERLDKGLSTLLSIAAACPLLRYVVQKGSIAVDGVSLTVVELQREHFSVSLIPETLKQTTLGDTQVGQRVNLEVDVLAKYVEKLVQR